MRGYYQSLTKPPGRPTVRGRVLVYPRRNPPLTSMVTPVTYAESDEAKKRMTPA